MAIDTAEKRRAIAGLSMWILPEVTPNAAQDVGWRGEAAYGYAFFAPAPPSAGTDRKTRRTRRPDWEAVDVVVVDRPPVLATLITRQRAARDMRLQQEQLARDEQRIRQEAIAAAVARVDAERQETIARLDRKKKSVANLALAQLARDRKQRAEEEKRARRRRTAIANLRKARKK